MNRSTPPTLTLDARGLPEGYNFRPDWEVTPRQAKQMLDRNQAVLIDCRRQDEFDLVRIEGARLAPLQELEARLDELDDLRDQTVIVQCHHGVRSLRATAFLRQHGFTDVKSMAGGIDVWAVDIDPGMTRY